MMNIGFFRDGKNDRSLGRLLLFIASLAGIFLLCLGAYVLVWTMFFSVVSYVNPFQILGLGVTLLVGSGGGKLVQSNIEANDSSASKEKL